MRTNIKTTNFKLTLSSEDLINKKLVRPIQRLLEKMDEKSDLIFDIELERSTKHHRKGKIWRVEAQLNLPGIVRTLRAEEAAESLREAVDIVKYELLREIKKYKEKRRIQD